MARDVPATALAALQAEHRWVQVLLKVEAQPTKYYAAGAFDFLHGGDSYEARAFEVAPFKYGAPGQAGTSVVIDNRDSELSNLAYVSGVSGSTLTITWLVRDDINDDWSTAYEVVAAEIAEVGGGGGETVTLQIRGDRRLASRALGGGPVTKSCRHREFKGARCKYAGGDTTCDRSWVDCTSKSNTANFGGIRHAPSAGESIEVARGRPVHVSTPSSPVESDDPWAGIPWAYRSLIDPNYGVPEPEGARRGARRVGG